MTYPTEVSETQAQKAVTVNENAAAVAPAAIFGYRAAGSSGLTFAYWGGWMLLGSPLTLTQIPDGSVTLAEGPNYIEANPDTGAVTVKNGSPTPVSFTSGMIPLYTVTVTGGLPGTPTDYRSFALQRMP